MRHLSGMEFGDGPYEREFGDGPHPHPIFFRWVTGSCAGYADPLILSTREAGEDGTGGTGGGSERL